MDPTTFLCLAALLVQTPDQPAPRVWGLRRDVSDLTAATRFYEHGLGFRLEGRAPDEGAAVLAKGDLRLLLRAVPELEPGRAGRGFSLNLQVADLEAAAGLVVKTGGALDGERPEQVAIGLAWSVRDPDGHPVNLMDLSSWREAPAEGCTVFNLGWKVEDLELAERSCERLGWRVSTRDYLPETLPLARHGAVPLVLHRGGAAAGGDPTSALLLSVESLASAGPRLSERGLEPAPQDTLASPLGTPVALLGPGGARLELLEEAAALHRIASWRAKAAPPSGH